MSEQKNEINPASTIPVVPEKFLTKDGKLNSDELLKSYLALEKKMSTPRQTQNGTIPNKAEDYKSAKEIFTELLPDIQTSKTYEYMGLCDFAMEDYLSALMNIDKALILSDDDEYLQNKYNEIKEILESSNNE